MKISILADFLRPNGAGVMALLQGQLLRESGHEIHFIAVAASDDVVAGLRSSGIAVRRFTHREAPFDRRIEPTADTSLRRAAWHWIQSQVSEVSPDVLSIHNCGRVVDQHMIAELSRRLPVVFTAHDEWFIADSHYRYRDSGHVVRTFEPHRTNDLSLHRFEHLDDVEQRADRLTVIAPSRWLHRRCVERFPSIRTVHLRNPVDPDLFDAADRTAARAELGLDPHARIVLAVGNPSQGRKGLTRLARTLGEIDGPKPTLLAVGGESSFAGRRAATVLRPGALPSLVDFASTTTANLADYDDDVLMVSGLPRRLMGSAYGAADVVVHPSVIDNLPTVPIEAGLVGTRCLASDVGGTAETVAGPDDLFPFEISDRELADRIVDAIAGARAESPDDRARRRETQLERFAPKVHLSLLEPLLQRVVAA